MTLGHDEVSLHFAEMQTLILRGSEWAATGKVTLPVLDRLRNIYSNEALCPAASAVAGLQGIAYCRAPDSGLTGPATTNRRILVLIRGDNRSPGQRSPEVGAFRLRFFPAPVAGPPGHHHRRRRISADLRDRVDVPGHPGDHRSFCHRSRRALESADDGVGAGPDDRADRALRRFLRRSFRSSPC